MKTTAVLIGMSVALCLASPILAQQTVHLDGKIKQFECGDNCWLTVEADHGEETGICFATPCDEWFLNGEIPGNMINRTVRLQVGAAMSVNNEGDPMGLVISFEALEYLD